MNPPTPPTPWTTAPRLPRELQVEVTAACNLRCRMCLVRYAPPVDRVTGTMSLADFTALVDSVPGVERITLQGLGEPLLVPHLDDMITLAASRGIAVGFNTNGTLLTPERAERLVRAGLAWLHVSVDGATPATYEAIRDGSRFERVRRGVQAIVAARAAAGGNRPEISLVCVAMRRNHGELPALVRLAADWGVGRLWVQNLSHSFSDTDPAGGYAEIRSFTAAETLVGAAEAEASFAAARQAAVGLGVDLRLPARDEAPGPRRAGTPGCDWPWRSGYVTRDGALQPCCMVMGAERAQFGRLADGPFGDVWHSPASQEFRARLLSDEPPEVCRGCSSYRGVF
ncbi:MAG TPA: radical SAM protein [Acidimicrobiia bacterium]|nr:radical SAM protein [Acidimicrobiia bacterium]